MWQTAVISGITFCSVCFPQANISHVCDDPLPEKYPWSLGSCQNRKELFSVRKFFKLPQIVFSHHPGQDKVLYAPGIRTHLYFLVLLDPCTCRSAFALHLYQSTGASSLKEICVPLFHPGFLCSKGYSLYQVPAGDSGCKGYSVLSDITGVFFSFLQFPEHEALECSLIGSRSSWPFPACNGQNNKADTPQAEAEAAAAGVAEVARIWACQE